MISGVFVCFCYGLYLESEWWLSKFILFHRFVCTRYSRESMCAGFCFCLCVRVCVFVRDLCVWDFVSCERLF